ncbi:hypothetical protein OUZ56_021157 [Daphnia magna]|uniref:4'-phosphopantetheine phosphatase n=1 Tax=Daphnia magna TaxID=35525 RepID=A0ABQ9ZGK9_9CRUS|nr:hypothetical protein OUZ56_021157 [Daphnia magna]
MSLKRSGIRLELGKPQEKGIRFRRKGFDELLALAERGDHRKIDMLVKDIYGGDCTSLGLPGDLIASSFGKAAQAAPESIQEADIARSLLFAISNDIGQIASLYAMMHGLKKVYFGGYFLRNHPLSMHTVSFAINYWSRGQVQGLFLRHEGYLGAIGAFLKGAEECDADKYSWSENYAGSSGLQSPLPGHRLPSLPVAVSVDQLEMDRIDQGVLVYCPLLDQPASYVPDMVDLTEDAEARKYWLDCFEESLDKFVSQAIKSQPLSADAPARAQKFKEKYISRLQYLKQHPCAFGNLTVRSLLDTREHCLNEVDFPDPYLQQKQMENEAALLLLSDHLAELDALPWRQKHETAATNLLAGNVFDWGAKEAAALMQIPGFGFQQALAHLQTAWMSSSVFYHLPENC